MRVSGTIMVNDLRRRSRDGALYVFAVILPLGLAFVFSLLLGGDGRQFEARYAVADEDRGEVARVFTEQVLRSLAQDDRIHLRTVTSAQEGRRLTEAKEVDATFVIPAGFSSRVREGRTATLEVVGRVDAAVPTQIAREIAQSYATDLNAVRLALHVAGTGGADAEERARAAPSPLSVRQGAPAALRQLDSRTYYSAGMAMFFLFFTVMFSAIAILDERQSGTLPRLLVAPIPRRSIVLGKVGSGVVVGLVSMVIVAVTSTLVLGATWGDPFGVAVLVVCGVLAATGITTLVATFARNSEQAGNWQSVIAMVLGIFGGSLFPLAQLGNLAVVSYLTPHHWFLRGLANLAGDGPVAGVLVPAAVLLGFAVVTGWLALLRTGKMLAS